MKKSLGESLQEEIKMESNKNIESGESMYCQWIKRDNNVYIPSIKPNFVEKIPSGYYKINYNSEIGYHLTQKTINSDYLFDLPFDETEVIMGDIDNFWNSKENYNKYKLLHKRGIILYGPPGSGKTCITNRLISELMTKRNGLIFSIEDEYDLNYYKEFMGSTLRQIEPDRPIITIIEDIDGLLDHGHSVEKMLLNILDGINQIENVVYIATTNYPEKMEARLLNRPSRFDRKYKIGYPNAKVRKAYFENKFLKEDLDITLLKKMVKITEGLTISHLKEIFASVIIMNNDLDIIVKEMKDMANLPSSRNDKSDYGIGFYNKTTDDDGYDTISWED